MGGTVTVSLAKPGTAHPVQVAKVDPEGNWQVPRVPGGPIALAVVIPGSLAFSQSIAAPRRCEDHVYEITLPSGPATTIEGTVADVFGGPLDGADVDVIPEGTVNGFGFEQPVFRVDTDERGAFSIQVSPGRYVVRSAFPGYSSSSTGADTRQRDRVDVALVLSPGTTVSGRVVLGPSGPGVAGAEIRLVRLLEAGGSVVNHAARADGVSGPDGSFRLENVGFGSWAVHAISATASTEAPVEISVELYEQLEGVELTLVSGTPVYGKVRERGGDVPVAGALVTLKGDTSILVCDESDAQGQFDCGSVPKGRYHTIVAHKEYAGNLLGGVINVAEQDEFLDLEVERGYMIAGRVSPPIQGIEIRARMDLAKLEFGTMGFAMMNAFRTTQTNAEGKFSMGPLSLGEVVLVAEHVAHGRAELEIDAEIARQGGEVELVLAPAARVSGVVSNLGAASGLQLVLSPTGEPQRIDGTRAAGSPLYEIDVGDDGQFAAQGLEPGSYALVLRHSRGTVGFEGPTKLELAEGADERLDLAVTSKQETFRGRVEDEDGGAVEGAVVFADQDRSLQAVSDSEGRFELIAWTDEGALAVRFHRAGYSTAALDATLRVEGPNALIVPPESELTVQHPGERGKVVILGKTRIERTASDSGSTVVTGLLAGKYRVVFCGEKSYGSVETEVTGASATVSVEGDGWLSAEGRALAPDGEPLAGYQVFALPTRDACDTFSRAAIESFTTQVNRTDDQGAFRITGLPPGPLLLHFVGTGENAQELATTVAVERGAAEVVDLGDVQL
ncbi:carboxypeptidase regulatory-like domain-containing protein [Nannocystaceae bacterium ST9]